MKEKIEFLLGKLPKIIKDADERLKDVTGNWWTFKNKVLKGIASRREPHLVYEVAHYYSNLGYIVTLEEGYNGDDNHKKKCDLAIVLEKTIDKWLWLEFKTMPLEDITNKLNEASKDVEKLRDVGKSSARNCPQGIVLIGFTYSNTNKMQEKFEDFARNNGIESWPIKKLETITINTRTDSYDKCVISYWIRLNRRSK